MLPNFLCIGAQKSGTTTLLQQLARHPDVFMAPARETQFFLLDHLYSQGPAAYEIGYFQEWDGQKAVGEKTPEYLCDPAVPLRIRDTLGKGVKFIVALRSPAQRAFSHYRHNFQQFWENLDFRTALAEEPVRCAAGRYQKLRYGYLDRGYYGRQIGRYLALFPRDVFLFLVYEQDIVQRQAEALRRVFGFLDVDAGFTPTGTVSAGRALPITPRIFERRESLEIEGERLEASPGDLLLTRSLMKPRLIKSPSPALLEFARGVSANLPQSQSLAREEELALNRAHFRDDIRELAGIIGRDLGSWLD